MDKVKSNQTSGKRHHEVVVDLKLNGGEPSNLHQVLDAKKKPARVPAKNPPPGSEAEVEKETQLEKLDP